MAPERGAHLRVKGAVYSALKRASPMPVYLARHCPMAPRWKPATVTTNRMPW